MERGKVGRRRGEEKGGGQGEEGVSGRNGSR